MIEQPKICPGAKEAIANAIIAAWKNEGAVRDEKDALYTASSLAGNILTEIGRAGYWITISPIRSKKQPGLRKGEVVIERPQRGEIRVVDGNLTTEQISKLRAKRKAEQHFRLPSLKSPEQP